MPTLTPAPAGVSADNEQTLHLTRVIKADRRRVYAAWTEPEQMRAWFAPGHLHIPDITRDLRVGGSYRVEMVGTMDGQLPPDGVEPHMTAHGIYREIIPGERLSFTWNGSWSPGEETLITVNFRDVPAGTEISIVHERFAGPQSRDSHNLGWNSTLGKLEALLAG